MHIKPKQNILNRKIRADEFLNKKPHYGFVYFLIQNDEVVYVGQTVRLPERLKAHKNKRYPLMYKEFSHFSTLRVWTKDLLTTEYAYISLFDPKYNIQKPKKK